MAKAKVTEAEFIRIWQELGSPSLVSKRIGISSPRVHERRNSIEKRTGIKLETFNSQDLSVTMKKHSGRININLQDGITVVFSDAHYYPDLISTAHRALLKIIEQMHPQIVVCNGDAFDGGSISRYPRIGWDNKPTVKQEIEAVTDRLGEIEAASKGKLIWTLGNHDARYETFLAANAPQYEGVHGFSLKDTFPRWLPCWSCWVNSGHPNNVIPTIIKHRWKGGIHATHNNTVNSGVNFVTGHLHSLKVTPFSDYTGTRYGVDTGTIADAYGPQFLDYTEDSPVNWRSGFVVLTYFKGKLLPPELVQVWDEDAGIVTFRGALIQV